MKRTVASTAGNSTNNGSSSHDVAYVHVAVNHAVCDAFCIVPLIADLLALHEAAVKAERDATLSDKKGTLAEIAARSRQRARDIGTLADKALEIASLPRAPNGLELQTARLRHALDPKSKAIDVNDFCYNVFSPRRPGHDCYVRIKASGCSLLESGSSILGIPPDHLLVAITAAAFACITGRPEVRLSLIVPLRDGTGEGNCIGNFATTRHLTLLLGKRSLLSVALDLSQRLRRRDWELSDVINDDGDYLFVNVRDIPKLEGARAVMEDADTTKSSSNFVKTIMEMFVDKESQSSWAYIIGIRNDLDGNRFGQALKKALWNISVDPLALAIPCLPPPPATKAVALPGKREQTCVAA